MACTQEQCSMGFGRIILGKVSESGLEDIVCWMLCKVGTMTAWLNMIIQQHRKVAYLISH